MVKRYKAPSSMVGYHPVESDTGSYVWYEDYKAMEERLLRVEAMVETFRHLVWVHDPLREAANKYFDEFPDAACAARSALEGK